jgi:hypothetical protein
MVVRRIAVLVAMLVVLASMVEYALVMPGSADSVATGGTIIVEN